MRPSRSKALIEKSIAACIAAIEIYNKPNFQYREETFSILMLNAWELLLKARIIQHNQGDIRSIEEREYRNKKDGSKKKYSQRKLNRSGNPMTIQLERAINLVLSYSDNTLDNACRENLRLLQEIRDNSVHFINLSPGLSTRILEVGSAALRNFAVASEKWFNVDLSRYNFYLMPVSFYSPEEVLESLSNAKNSKIVQRLLDSISNAERQNPFKESNQYNVTLQIQVKFSRTGKDGVPKVRIAHDDPEATPIVLSEEDIRANYPWTYAELTKRLALRYKDFSQNNRYHSIRKNLEKIQKFCKIRYLDPNSPSSGTKKKFYNPNILSEFDKHYTIN